MGCLNPRLFEVDATTERATAVHNGNSTYEYGSRVVGDADFNGTTALQIETLYTQTLSLFGNTYIFDYRRLDYVRPSADGTGMLLHGYVDTYEEPCDRCWRESHSYDPPIVFRYDLEPGETYTQSFVVTTDDVYETSPPEMPPQHPYDATLTVRYVGREVIEVSAGLFETCRFEFQGEAGGRDATLWIGVGNGLTIRESAGDEFEELLSGSVDGVPLQSLPFEPVENRTRSLRHTDLALDLVTLSGRAVVQVERGGQGVSLEVGDLDIRSVSGPNGALLYRVVNGWLDIGMPSREAVVTIDYGFRPHMNFDGWMPDVGASFLWPNHCANLFPCRSDLAHAQTYSLSMSGVPEGATAVVPSWIGAPVPAYVPAVAVGNYIERPLGTTSNGTRLSVWHLPGQEEAAITGTRQLLSVMDFYERTYGPYAFGNAAGSVSVGWPAGRYGGIEHHPFWHVATSSLGDPQVHAHEAAHGWYGNGVRIACWEDFVLSEGVASYMAARALQAAGTELWPRYECTLQDICSDPQHNTVARPSGCGGIDIANHPLWSDVPYMKGAFFLREVAELVGADAVDATLAGLYKSSVGSLPAHMDDMVRILTATNPDHELEIRQLANDWLYRRECPLRPERACPP